MDGQIPQLLVGAENMEKANALLAKMHADWQATRKDETQKQEEYAEKEALLKRDFGFTEIEWSKLIGTRASNGKFEGGGGLAISGKLDTDKTKANRIWITKDGPRGGSVVGLSPASYGRLFALAQITPEEE